MKPIRMFFCATIPAAAVQTEGLEWYIVAKDIFGVLNFYGTMETPNTLYVNPLLPDNPGTNTMQITFEREKLLFDCEPLKAGLVIQIFSKTACGEEQLNQSYEVQGDEEEITLTIYGDSDPTDGYKIGFAEDEELTIKILDGRFDYLLQNRENPIIYASGTIYACDIPFTITTISGIEISGNEIPILNGTTITSTADGTDFGKTSIPVTHTFSLENTKCDNLHISSFYSDNDNFSIAGLPVYGELIPAGETRNFTITYNAIETASAEIRLYTNALGDYLYTFIVSGEIDDGIETSVINFTFENKPKISVFNNTIIIENTSEPVKVYNITGQCLAQGFFSEYTVSQTGVYIIQVGAAIEKVIVK